MSFKYTIKIVALALAYSFCSPGTKAQRPADKSLFAEIMLQDSILFTAFNTRDTSLFTSMFATDLEFYHDKGGLTDYTHTVNFMRSVSKPGNDLYRALIKEKAEVYPIANYGAIQIGEHRFCHTENDKNECGTFKFMHIWQLKDGVWKITRIVSYDH